MKLRRCLFLLMITLLIAGASPFVISRAQDTTTTITLGVPDYMRDIFTPEVLGKFEADHPGVNIEVREANADIPSPAISLDKHFEAVQKYVSAADVLYVDSQIMSPESTRAGYYLDLAPLVSGDKTLNIDDFWPSLWNAFQWDKGMWALPTGAEVVVLTYLPSAFDAAGLAYPNEKWTASDLFNAARKLTQKDANGNVTVHGLAVFANGAQGGSLRAMIGENLFDSSTIPDSPKLTGTAVENVLDEWVKLDNEGVIGNDFDKAPLSISPIFALGMRSVQGDQVEKRVGVLLPGNKGGLDVQGYAVSSGTQHPDLAYALANFLTTQVETSGRFGNTSARKNAATLTGGPGKGGDSVRIDMPPEIKALTEQAVNNGLALSDLRYSDYLLVALEKMKSDGVDAATALQSVEVQAVANQQAALAKKDKVNVVVATPVPVVVQPGKATLKFGITSFLSPMPNRDKWDQLARDFAASDAEVGKINIDVSFGSVEESTDKYDCFYLPYNGVPSAKLDGLLNLDPYLSADKSFDKADVVGNVMAQLQRDNKTWAFPIMIEPAALKYDSQKFAKANVPAPTNVWTIDQFNDALKALKPDSSEPPFVSNGPGGTHLLSLIAAYGGLPFDYRTSPATVNFTDPATVAAIRQVLDLAKAGYIKYEALGSVGTSFAFGGGPTAPILNQDIGGIRVRRGGSDTQEDPYKPTLYPHGSKYNALSYSIGTGYISAKSQNPDACYRWLSTLAQHPELFSSMPVRRSMINNPAVTAVQGSDITAMYNQIDKLLADPNTISLPSLFEGGAVPIGFITQHWLYEAFDTYVLKDGDLDTALQDADRYVKAFQECTAGIAPYDPSSGQTQQEYGKQYLTCAAKVDPRLKSFVEGIQ